MEKIINPGQIIVPEQSFNSYKESEKLLRYITRNRKDEKKAEDLLTWSGRGVSLHGGIEAVIKDFEWIQRQYKTDETAYGRHCYHEFFCLRREYAELLGERLRAVLVELAENCMTIYWDNHFQVVCASHKSQEDIPYVHIHFAVNAVCLGTGKKWYSCDLDRRRRERQMNKFAIDLNPLWRKNYGLDIECTQSNA